MINHTEKCDISRTSFVQEQFYSYYKELILTAKLKELLIYN